MNNNTITFLIPIYPPHYVDIKVFLESFYKFNYKTQADIWFIFSNQEEKELFGEWKNSLILPDYLAQVPDRQQINIKKFYGLMQLQERYEYIIIIDAESELIKNIDLQTLCDTYYKEKKLYGNKTLYNTYPVINESLSFFKDNPDINTINLELYLWFNQLCIYKTDMLSHFFTVTDIQHTLQDVPVLAFDYYIFMFYLILYQNFTIIDLECTAPWSMLESNYIIPPPFHYIGDTTIPMYKKIQFYHCNPALQDVLNTQQIFLLIQKDKYTVYKQELKKKVFRRIANLFALFCIGKNNRQRRHRVRDTIQAKLLSMFSIS